MSDMSTIYLGLLAFAVVVAVAICLAVAFMRLADLERDFREHRLSSRDSEMSIRLHTLADRITAVEAAHLETPSRQARAINLTAVPK